MVDPIAIIGAAGALANIIQVASQTIIAIRDLQSDWNDADLAFLSLTGQLSALRLALTKIEEWMGMNTGDAHHQLVMDLDDSINCCQVLLTKLHAVVECLQQKQNKALTFRSKIKLVFGKKNIDDIQKLLEHQTNALSLLLTACNCKTGTEQKVLLERSSSRKVFHQMNLDSASLMALYDADSIATQITDNLSKLSLTFSFDHEIFTSDVYGRFFRGLTKRVLGYPQPEICPVVGRPRGVVEIPRGVVEIPRGVVEIPRGVVERRREVVVTMNGGITDRKLFCSVVTSPEGTVFSITSSASGEAKP